MGSIPRALASAMDKSLNAQNDLVKSTEHLDNAMLNAKKEPLRSIAISAVQGQYLSMLCQLIKARSGLKTETSDGYSTTYFANSVPGTQVTSIEFIPKHRVVALENLKGMDNVVIRLGSTLDVLPKLASLRVFSAREQGMDTI